VVVKQLLVVAADRGSDVAVVGWIERTYNQRRRQRALGKLTPVEFEAIIGDTHLAQAA
jgi:putative transposase